MVIPASVSKIIKLFCFIILTGILFANSIIVAAAFLAVIFIITGIFLKPPSELTVKRTYSREKLFTGDRLEITTEIDIEAGTGIIVLNDVIPKHFELAGGNNYKVVWKGMAPKKVILNYNIRSFVSGKYYLGNLIWESKHCLTKQLYRNTESEGREIEVRPRFLETGKMKGAVNFSRIPMPLGSIAKIGMPTNDFKEIKQYSYGDPFKYINWKATARNLYKGGFWPVVNEYDKEGKKVVWIYLNTSKIMNFGTSIKNVSEFSMEAVCALADFYLKQSCYVAFSTYNGEKSFLYPDTGKKQLHLIMRELLECGNCMRNGTNKSPKTVLNLYESVIAHKKYFEGSRPLFIVVTRFNEKYSDTFMQGIKEMTKYTANNKGLFQIMIVNICGHQIAAQTETENLAAKLLEARDMNLFRQLKKMCTWINWNPAEMSFSCALTKQVVG